MHIKYSSIVKVLEVVSNVGHVTLHLSTGLRINTAGYVEILKTAGKPWMDEISSGKSYMCSNQTLHLFTKLTNLKNGCQIIFMII